MASYEEGEAYLKEETESDASEAQTLTKSQYVLPNSMSYQRRHRSLTRSYCLSALVFSLTTLFWGSILLYVVRDTPHTYHMTGDYAERNQIFGIPISKYKFLKCGTSIEEAKKLGCVYDILTNHWVPRPCLDAAAIEAYQADGSWHGFANENRTQPLSLESMGDRARYYTSVRDHIVHCAMLWNKQYSIWSDGRRIVDSITADPDHTHHCINYLMEMTDQGADLREVPLTVDVGFAGCFLGD